MASRRAAQVAVVLTAAGALTIACGKKGPPLAPLHLVPAAASEMSVRRVADRARLRFVLPSRNENGPGPLELDRVEIFAMTVGPDGAFESPPTAATVAIMNATPPMTWRPWKPVSR